MEYKDTLTFEQPVVKVILEEEQSKLLQSQLYSEVLKILTKPVTAKEVYVTLQDSNYEKSQTSVYRLLQDLERVDLITKAGARVYPKNIDNKIVAETLYLKSAKILYDAFFKYSDENRAKRVAEDPSLVDLQGNLLSDVIGGKKVNMEKFENLFLKLMAKWEETIVRIFEQGSEENLNRLFYEVDWKTRNGVLNNLVWLLFWKEQQVPISELESCLVNE